MKRRFFALLIAFSLVFANVTLVFAVDLEGVNTQEVDVQDTTELSNSIEETPLVENIAEGVEPTGNNSETLSTGVSENIENLENVENTPETDFNTPLIGTTDEEAPALNETSETNETNETNDIIETNDTIDSEGSLTTEVEHNEEPIYENFVGKTESDLSEDLLTDEHTIITYIVREDVPEGTIISQTFQDGQLILEVATAPVVTEPTMSFNLLNSFDLMDEMTEPPSLEQGTWSNYPTSYEYNWDNSQNCWNWGEWKDGVKYTTPEGTYDNNVRHEMGMYSDGENIHLRISYATIYSAIANGDDMNFYIDGQGAKFRVLYADNGSGITGQSRPEGTYDLVVVNGDHWNSSYEANGSYGTMIVKDGNINNEMEIVIPLETLKEQNNNIDIDHIQTIEFFNPNLMYRHISCGGASTGSIGFIVMTIIVFVLGFVIYQRRDLFNIEPLNCCVG